MIVDNSEGPLWGCPLWANVTPDGWLVKVGGRYVWHSLEEAEEAAKKSSIRLETIRIQ